MSCVAEGEEGKELIAQSSKLIVKGLNSSGYDLSAIRYELINYGVIYFESFKL